jgi:hypothetical protein
VAHFDRVAVNSAALDPCAPHGGMHALDDPVESIGL